MIMETPAPTWSWVNTMVWLGCCPWSQCMTAWPPLWSPVTTLSISGLQVTDRGTIVLSWGDYFTRLWQNMQENCLFLIIQLSLQKHLFSTFTILFFIWAWKFLWLILCKWLQESPWIFLPVALTAGTVLLITSPATWCLHSWPSPWPSSSSSPSALSPSGNITRSVEPFYPLRCSNYL